LSCSQISCSQIDDGVILTRNVIGSFQRLPYGTSRVPLLDEGRNHSYTSATTELWANARGNVLLRPVVSIPGLLKQASEDRTSVRVPNVSRLDLVAVALAVRLQSARFTY
jgi:hypothetical protein